MGCYALDFVMKPFSSFFFGGGGRPLPPGHAPPPQLTHVYAHILPTPSLYVYIHTSHDINHNNPNVCTTNVGENFICIPSLAQAKPICKCKVL